MAQDLPIYKIIMFIENTLLKIKQMISHLGSDIFLKNFGTNILYYNEFLFFYLSTFLLYC